MSLIDLIWIIIFALIQVRAAYRDARLIESGTYPNHRDNAIIAVATAIAYNIIDSVIQSKIIILFPLLLAIRWIIFDIALNLYRKKPLDYIGIPDKEDAILDNVLFRHPGLQYVIKFTLLFITFLIYKYVQIS